VVRAKNATLVDAEGRQYVDLFSACGTAWLGHAHEGVGRRIAEQLERTWITGALETPELEQARTAVEAWFPGSHGLAVLYSTGMEAAEFAMRVARVATGRNGMAGFERAMHGKSMATAHLGWDNGDGLELPGFHRFPFVPDASEPEILEQVDRALAARATAAVFVEPLHASGGGHRASDDFYRALRERCRDHGTLLVFDEVLTGFRRTGPAFMFSGLGFVPDLVLVGKAMGNGFPVSAVVADRAIGISPRMLPGSTFSGNPLAAVAVAATLEEMGRIDLEGRVAQIDTIVRRVLGSLDATPAVVRGAGALWVVELPVHADLAAAVQRIYDRGVAVGSAGRSVRILPAATIEPERLERGCAVLADELARACRAAGG
jgi:4-aminobutyrate aminotransferase-like enzyme